ncbi:MAG TPA: HDOD domain-containing protein [Candidatus Hydrogenedentes bacterium]|nr:HDOD domain-containing protein [Candidatus Hydrogenedentota bacterium]HOL77812.1 HDOD domain-containing protein [Candidatus Hydrogenedentota bacterium]HPO86874.1 HDOD domain-containing protein [Candidatus Hydrogenedentota bacterium]
MMETHEKLDKILDKVGDLPALPSVVTEVMHLTEDPGVDVNDLCKVIQKDPALAAKILRVSNSPYYGMRQYVGTLKLALVILGVREVRNLILGISVVETLRDDRAEALLGDAFWKHSMHAASFARKLSGRFKLVMQGEAFVSGLLHDIGKIAFVRYARQQYGSVFRCSGGASEPLCRLEKETFGFTHAELGAALGFRWNFPQTLTDAIYFHHPARDMYLADAKDPQLAAVVRLANRLARVDKKSAVEEKTRGIEEPEAWQQFEPEVRCLSYEDKQTLVEELVKDLNGSPLPIF